MNYSLGGCRPGPPKPMRGPAVVTAIGSNPDTTTSASGSRPTSVSGQLRARTRAAHCAVEQQLTFDRLTRGEELAAMLRGWNTVWSDVRTAASTASACREVSEELRSPAIEALAWLQRDLVDLGAPTTASADERDTAHTARLVRLLGRPAASWGVAYVLRGSRLGGTVIAPRVDQALGLVDGRGTRFLTSAGTDPGREWVAFRRRLDRCTFSPDELESAIEAAGWTFGWVGAVVSAGMRSAPVPA